VCVVWVLGGMNTKPLTTTMEPPQTLNTTPELYSTITSLLFKNANRKMKVNPVTSPLYEGHIK